MKGFSVDLQWSNEQHNNIKLQHIHNRMWLSSVNLNINEDVSSKKKKPTILTKKLKKNSCNSLSIYYPDPSVTVLEVMQKAYFLEDTHVNKISH